MIKLKALWEKIKKWAKETALPWLKKSAIQIINVIIVFFAYSQLLNAASIPNIKLGFAAGLVGFWGFILLGYWLFWKLFGFDKVWASLMKQWKKKREMRQ